MLAVGLEGETNSYSDGLGVCPPSAPLDRVRLLERRSDRDGCHCQPVSVSTPRWVGDDANAVTPYPPAGQVAAGHKIPVELEIAEECRSAIK
jgi:hypothetical protein